MSEYISTYTTGFSEIIKSQINKDLPGVRVIELYDGLIHFSYNKEIQHFESLVYLNNIFFVIKCFKDKFISFKEMINCICKTKQKFPITNGSFRVRFSKGNEFVKVDNNLVKKIENHILDESNLKVDRVNPSTEIWFFIRNDGVAFCGQLLFKRKITEKYLFKGELRPEFAYLMCLCANITKDTVVYDPFCGSGAIPKQLISKFMVKMVLASDIDKKKISVLKDSINMSSDRFKCFEANALSMDMITDNSVDIIITDPPWGYYEQIDDIKLFYENMLREFLRITKKDATIIVLSARKQEFKDACLNMGAMITSQIDTLVNGKKAAVFTLHF